MLSSTFHSSNRVLLTVSIYQHNKYRRITLTCMMIDYTLAEVTGDNIVLTIAIMVFIIAGIFGLIILNAALKNQPTPKIFVFWHGPIALFGLVLVFVAIY